MPFVGLTGGIGAGKSEALAALERLGAATLSTDAVVHELYAIREVRDAVVERWGDEVAPGGRRRPRARWRRARSPTPEERAWLEGLLWPRVGRAGRRVARGRVARASRRRARRVVETPLLFEAGLEALYDATIAVVADEDVRAERAAARGHEAVDERAARQLYRRRKRNVRRTRSTTAGTRRRVGVDTVCRP